MEEEEVVAEVVPPPAGGGVLQRLRALSYGSRGQFNENSQGPMVAQQQQIEPAGKAGGGEARGEMGGSDGKEDKGSEGVEVAKALPPPSLSKIDEDDFESRYYELQNKYLEVQKTVLKLQKAKEEEDENRFDEIETLQFECQSQQVELEKTKRENERLHLELAQKGRQIVELKDELIEKGNLAMQKHTKLLALPPSQSGRPQEPAGSDASLAEANSRLTDDLHGARSELETLQRKAMQQDLQVKNLENELKHKGLDNEAKTKRQNNLLNEVHDLRISNLQKKKEVDTLEREIELMLSEKWNSQHYSTKKDTDFDAPSAGARYKRFNDTIKACKDENILLRGQLKDREREAAKLSEDLSDTRRMAKVTETVLTKKINELRTGNDRANDKVAEVEISLKRSIDGLVKALEEQESKTEQLEEELRGVGTVLEAVDKLGIVVGGHEEASGGGETSRAEARAGASAVARGGRMMLPSSASPSQAGPEQRVVASSAAAKRSFKKSRRKTIIPVLAQLPGAPRPAEQRPKPTSDQKFDIFLAIQQIPFLKAMDSSLQKELAEQAWLTQCCAGDALINQGETGREAFILLEGLLEVFTIVDGQEEVFKVVKPGAIIGEIALLKQEPRNTSVRAVTDSRLFVIEKQSLDAILAAHPEYRGGLEQLASQRQKENQDALQYKYALSTDLVDKEDIKSAILEDIITEPTLAPPMEIVTGAEARRMAREDAASRQDPSSNSDPKSGAESGAGDFVEKRLAILRATEAALLGLRAEKSALLARLSEKERQSTDKMDEIRSREEILREDLKNVNSEISNIKNELFATCKELEDRESDLQAKEGEVAVLKQDLDEFRRQKEEEEAKVKKEKEDMIELKRKYDEAAKAETDIMERTERLWSHINSQQHMDDYSSRRDNDLIQKLQTTKKGLSSLQNNLVFLDGKAIPPTKDFNIVVTPTSSKPTFFAESKGSSDHANNLRMIDSLIDQMN